jgi:hypothetical protein
LRAPTQEKTYANWHTSGYTNAMAKSDPTNVRLRPVVLAYLDDLAKLGCYGKGRSGVIRRFVENGITRAVERGVIPKRDAADFGEDQADDD